MHFPSTFTPIAEVLDLHFPFFSITTGLSIYTFRKILLSHKQVLISFHVPKWQLPSHVISVFGTYTQLVLQCKLNVVVVWPYTHPLIRMRTGASRCAVQKECSKHFSMLNPYEVWYESKHELIFSSHFTSLIFSSTFITFIKIFMEDIELKQDS